MPTAQHTRSLILAVLGGLAALVLLTVTALAFGTADVPWRDCLHFLWAGASEARCPPSTPRTIGSWSNPGCRGCCWRSLSAPDSAWWA